MWKLPAPFAYLLITVVCFVIIGFGTANLIDKYINYKNSQMAVYPMTENERAAFTAGMIVGLDISFALKGEPPMDKATWLSLADGFDKATQDCKDMDCVMSRIMSVRENIRQRMQPIGPETFR